MKASGASKVGDFLVLLSIVLKAKLIATSPP